MILAYIMAEQQKRSFVQEFVDFLKTFGVIGLAIAFVIGQAASKVVSALVNDIINPFIGLFLVDAGELRSLSLTIGNSTFLYGDLIAVIIEFIIIAFIVFIAYKQLTKYKIVEEKKK